VSGNSEIARAAKALAGCRQILVFTGAGVSTESGIPDFRGPDGLWTKLDPDDFHIDRYMSSRRVRVMRWRLHQQGELLGAGSQVEPNAAHLAIVELWEAGRMSGCVTQNIDGLHQEAGLPDDLVSELHGNARRTQCMSCPAQWPTAEVIEWVNAGQEEPRCPQCGGIVKTATVSFGQMLPEREVQKARFFSAMADGVLVIGSTLSVFPAAEIPASAARDGIPMVIVNLGPTAFDHLAAARIELPAGRAVPALVTALGAEAGA
jgi:NAD-dependent deacetylase